MQKGELINRKSFKISAIIIFTGLCALVTIVLAFPIPKTQGYLNLVDILVYFTGFTFGPLTGLIAGGIGPMIADISIGMGVWAPFTIAAHGLQGLLAGLLLRIFSKKENVPLAAYIITGVLGFFTMTIVYFFGGWIIEGLAKSIYSIPFNLGQGLVGIIFAIPLTKLVKKAYPPLKMYRF